MFAFARATIVCGYRGADAGLSQCPEQTCLDQLLATVTFGS